MPTYTIVIDLVAFLMSFSIVTNVTLTGDFKVTATVTTSTTLTTAQINNITTKYPFVTITQTN